MTSKVCPVCSETDTGAYYDEFSTERIRELTVETQEKGHVAPTLSAYYQAIVAPSVCGKAAAAARKGVRGNVHISRVGQ